MIDRFETFATTIALMNRYIQKIKSQEMCVLGLKGTHVMCLYKLGKEADGLTASQLCSLCGEDKAAISRAINELTEKDYVHSHSDTEKRAYRAKITLTDKGQKAIGYINERVEYILNLIGEGLSDSQRQMFYDTLFLISDHLKTYTQMQTVSDKIID